MGLGFLQDIEEYRFVNHSNPGDTGGGVRSASRAAFGPRVLAALGVMGILGVVVALVFVKVWDDYVTGLQPEYFKSQGLSWGRTYRSRVEALMERYLDERSHEEVAHWRESFPRWVQGHLEDAVAAVAGSRPLALAVVEAKTAEPVAAWGQGGALWGRRTVSGDAGQWAEVLRSDGDEVQVLIDLPLRAEEPLNSAFRLRVLLGFLPFSRGLRRGANYAWVLVLVYLVMLYGLFVLVYLLGRRETRLSFEAEERSSRLKAIGSVAAGIAHEVRNPLNAVSLNVQYLEKLNASAADRAPDAADFQRIRGELRKIEQVIDNFVAVAHLGAMEFGEFDLALMLEDMVASLRPEFEARGVEARFHGEGAGLVRGDEEKLRQILRHLTENALRALEDADEKRLDVAFDGRDRRRVRVTIRNSGPVPDPRVLANMFDPYWTSRISSRALGLTLAQVVAASHGGSLHAAPAHGGGVAVVLELPRSP